MTAKRGDVERAIAALSPDIRCFLFHGPDDSGSRALAHALSARVGPGAEKVTLTGAELRADPARLADEAASISLFGGARYIVVEQAGDEILPAVEALLEAPAAGNPVAIVAGTLRATSALLKCANASPAIIAFASYAPEDREADRMVMDMARGLGLTVAPAVARRIAEACANNRAIVGQELEKFALYADAAPDRPRAIDEDVLDEVGAASEGGDLSRFADSLAGGNGAALAAELARLAEHGTEGVPLVRAALTRMVLLARLRAEVEGGRTPADVMASAGKSIFWKEKAAIGRDVTRWRSPLLAKSVARLMDAQLALMAAGSAGVAAADEELFAICRQAARLR